MGKASAGADEMREAKRTGTRELLATVAIKKLKTVHDASFSVEIGRELVW